MKNVKIALYATVFTGFLATNAHADNYKVYQPQVDKGELSVEANLNYSADHRTANDNYFSQVVGFEYGLTDYWMTELSGEIEKEQGSGDQLTNIKWENIFAPFARGENWIDTGLYLEVEKAARDTDPNNFEAKLLLEKEFGKLDNTVNFIVSHEFGPNHSTDTNAGMALQTKYRLDKKFEPGVELYADMGKLGDMPAFKDQDYKAGPVIEGMIGHVKYSSGVLFGISSAAQDTTAKMNIEYEF
jgi:hypothetical protein